MTKYRSPSGASQRFKDGLPALAVGALLAGLLAGCEKKPVDFTNTAPPGASSSNFSPNQGGAAPPTQPTGNR